MTAFRRNSRFTLALGLFAMIIGFAARIAWRELHHLRASFAAVEHDSFHVSDYIEGPLANLNQTLLEHDVRGDEGTRTKFLQDGERLQKWLQTHTGGATNPEQRRLLMQIESALVTYLSQGANLMDNRITPEGHSVLEYVETTAAPITALTEQLAAAERTALGDFIDNAHRSLAWLQGFLLLCLFLLLVLAGIVGLSGYRELLAPLRTQLRQSRAIIERHEKLASLGTLAAGVAHEIRNPLTAINVRIHSLKRTLAQGSSELEDATIIDSEIKRLERIVQAFLQFARPAEPKLVTVSADSLLARARTLLAGQLEKKSIQLLLEPPPDLWIVVDPQQIEQVLINLIQNAADSIGQNGTIRLRARTDTSRLHTRSDSVVALEVSDTGKGIEPEVQKRLFDPFFTTKEEGTGLGLSIAARIVEQQGGALHYTTEVNRGTTFQIVFPASTHTNHEVTAENCAY